MPTSSDGASFTNISANTAAFKLGGDKYNVMAVATFGGGNVAFQVLGPDGTTWLPVGSAFSTRLRHGRCRAGQYRFAVTTAAAVYVSVWRVPS